MDKEVGLETGRAFDLAKIPLESPSLGAQPDEHEDERPEKSLYQKVYNAFGFQKAYNFPLCKSNRCLTCHKYGLPKHDRPHESGERRSFSQTGICLFNSNIGDISYRS